MIAALLTVAPLDASAATLADDPQAAPAAAETPSDATPPGEAPIVVTASPEAKQDPIAAVNVQTFKAVQAVDTAVTRPVAMAYKHTLPNGVRTGLRNLLLNLTEPVVFVNYALQLQPKRAAQTLGRFAINSTVGIGGVIDVAKNKPFHLKHHTNGFAYTLGYYGIPSGPYLFLPIIGPTTVRDMIGRTMDQLMVPTIVGSPFNAFTYSAPTGAVSALDFRVQADAALEKLHKADNPYAATRADYLARRKRDIAALRGPGHVIPLKDDIVQGATIDVPEAPGAKPAPKVDVAPIVAPAPAPAAGAAAPEPTPAPPVAKPAPAPLILTPSAPPSTKPRP